MVPAASRIGSETETVVPRPGSVRMSRLPPARTNG